MTQVTTVKIGMRTKAALDELKGEKETYDEVISKLAVQARDKTMKSQLVEAYKSVGKDDLKILEEWESASAELNNDD